MSLISDMYWEIEIIFFEKRKGSGYKGIHK